MEYRQKLIRDINDVCLFGLGKHYWESKSAQIVDVILDTIKKGLEKDGFVTIEGFGRFYTKTRWKGYKGIGLPNDPTKFNQKTRVVTVAAWTGSKGLRKSFDEKDEECK